MIKISNKSQTKGLNFTLGKKLVQYTCKAIDKVILLPKKNRLCVIAGSSPVHHSHLAKILAKWEETPYEL